MNKIDSSKYITPDLISERVAKYLYDLNRKSITLDNQLLNLTYKKNNISDVLNISFIRNNKTYNKKIYFYISNKIKNNIINLTNMKSQFFSDCTHNVVLCHNKNYKLYIY